MFGIIPGIIISILTFPGIIFHEFGHVLFCKWGGVKVKEVCYFRLGNPAGYVIHEAPENFRQSFMICVGPLISSSILAFLLFVPANVFMLLGQSSPNSPLILLLLPLLWLGVSIAMHAFPSTGDAKVLWEESKRHSSKDSLTLIGYPVAALIWIASILRVIWFDAIYAWILFFIASLPILLIRSILKI